MKEREGMRRKTRTTTSEEEEKGFVLCVFRCFKVLLSFIPFDRTCRARPLRTLATVQQSPSVADSCLAVSVTVSATIMHHGTCSLAKHSSSSSRVDPLIRSALEVFRDAGPSTLLSFLQQP